MGLGIAVTVFLIAVLFSEGRYFKKLTPLQNQSAEEKENVLLFMLPFKSSGKEMADL